jgi:hypothetical protein
MRSNFNSGMAAASLVILTMAFSNAAFANSCFTVRNDTSIKFLTEVYNGDDNVCSSMAKDKWTKPGHSEGIGCAGGGKHRCKINIRDAEKDGQARPAVPLLTPIMASHLRRMSGVESAAAKFRFRRERQLWAGTAPAAP